MKKIDPRKAIFKPSKEIGTGKVQGYDFDKPFNPSKFFASFSDTGFQATSLGKAISLVKKMRKEKAEIYLGFTSNASSCGTRDIITYLVKNKLVDFLVTTTGGIEEDIMKTHGNFLHGDFNADGKYLRKNGVNRTGNLFIPNERYIWFESFIHPILEKFYKRQKTTGKIANSVEIIQEMGKSLEGKKNHKQSFVYWAWKNKIPLLSVPLADGATGDHIYFFRTEHRDFQIDLVAELELISERALEGKKSGAIILGGSVPKHHIMNAFLLREGIDYTVYLNTGYEGEGSNAGANPEEAKSWGKATSDENTVKVWGDFSITFPLLVAGGFKL